MCDSILYYSLYSYNTWVFPDYYSMSRYNSVCPVAQNTVRSNSMNSTRAIHGFVSLVFKANVCVWVFQLPKLQSEPESWKTDCSLFYLHISTGLFSLSNRQFFSPVTFVQPGCCQWILTKQRYYFIDNFSNTWQIRLLGRLRNEDIWFVTQAHSRWVEEVSLVSYLDILSARQYYHMFWGFFIR